MVTTDFDAQKTVKDLGLDVPANLISDLALSGYEDDTTKRLLIMKHIMAKAKVPTMTPMLPLLLNLKGEPFHLKDHYPFQPFFRCQMPNKTILKTGRQVGKSASQAALGVVQSNCIPWFNTLFITPLFEMVRRFSQNYVRPFVEESPVKDLFVGKNTVNSVLQKTFRNNSQMMFTFAYLDCTRVRGLSADRVCIDEVQDLDKSFLPIINETMSGSKWKGIEAYSGTPLTLDNTIQALWNSSSQAEWLIDCHKCKYTNVPALSHDLDDMIGPWRPDISEAKPGCICAKCGEPIFPRTGRWVHRYPEKRLTFAGYHVPQVVMPMHYADPKKWSTLLGKRSGKGNTPINVFYNEVCGESYDVGTKLVSLTELRAAAVLPWQNKLEEAVKHTHNYTHRVVGVDWGGGGQDGISFTTAAVLGMLPNGKVHVLYGIRSLTPHDHVREAKLVLGLIQRFQAMVLAHDYTGAGALRETFICQAGFPTDRIAPMHYQRAAVGNLVKHKPATELHPRDYYLLDKSRSLVLTCNQIKTGWLQFFEYDYVNEEEEGLLHDFLALTEEKTDSRLGKDIYTVIRQEGRIDDFAHACNVGLMTLYHMTGKWPNIAAVQDMTPDPATLNAVHPLEEVEWGDI